jgi:hypothetical protein
LLVMLLLYWNHMHHQLQKNQYYLEIYLHENTKKQISAKVGVKVYNVGTNNCEPICIWLILTYLVT